MNVYINLPINLSIINEIINHLYVSISTRRQYCVRRACDIAKQVAAQVQLQTSKRIIKLAFVHMKVSKIIHNRVKNPIILRRYDMIYVSCVHVYVWLYLNCYNHIIQSCAYKNLGTSCRPFACNEALWVVPQTLIFDSSQQTMQSTQEEKILTQSTSLSADSFGCLVQVWVMLTFFPWIPLMKIYRFFFFVDRCRRVRYYEIKRIFYEWKWLTFDEIEDNNGTGGRRSPTTR